MSHPEQQRNKSITECDSCCSSSRPGFFILGDEILYVFRWHIGPISAVSYECLEHEVIRVLTMFFFSVFPNRTSIKSHERREKRMTSRTISIISECSVQNVRPEKKLLSFPETFCKIHGLPTIILDAPNSGKCPLTHRQNVLQ